MCLKQSDKCTTYSGPSFQNIGIEQNIDQAGYNTQLASVVSALKAKMDACACGSSISQSTDSTIGLSNNTFTGYAATSCLTDVVYRSFKYETYTVVAPVTMGFTYDASTFNSALPQGIILESLRVRITKNNTIIANLSGISSGVRLESSELPASATLEARLNSSCGHLLFSKTIYISNTPESKTLDFDATDSGGQYSLQTQEELNSVLYSKISKLEAASDISGLKVMIQDLQNQINILKTQIS